MADEDANEERELREAGGELQQIPMGDLAGKVALVTGASSGIGLAISSLLALKGAYVVMLARSEERLAAAKRAILKQQPGSKLETISCDVGQFGDFQALFQERIKEWGRLDILVNNAGVTQDGLLIKMRDSQWFDVLHTNLTSSFETCRAASKVMLRQRSGSIINISSVTALMGNAGQVNYSAAKAGMIGMTKSLAKELGSRGVRVNSIAPGFIETKMTQEIPLALREQYKSVIAMGRFGSCSEVAKTAWFLASDLSSYITGQVLVVDGGLFMA